MAGTRTALGDIADLPVRAIPVHGLTSLAVQDVGVRKGGREPLQRVPLQTLAAWLMEFVVDLLEESISAVKLHDFTPTLTETGNTWVLPVKPILALAFLNGVLIRKVGSAPDESSCTLADATITTGRNLIAGERLEVAYVA